MQLKKVNHISDSLYDEIKSFCNYNIYHSKQWHAFLSKSFDWNISFVIGVYSDKVCFILPFVEKKRYNMRKYTVSLPFSHKINIAYDPLFKDRLIEFENNIGSFCSNIEIHDECISNVFRKSSLNNITKIDLTKFRNAEEIFASFDYKSIKYEINKFHRFNLEVKDSISDQAAKDFYSLELETRKRLGSPVYPEDFFVNLFNSLNSEDIFVKIVYSDSKPIAGIILIKYNDSALYAYSAYSDEMKSKKLNSTEYLIFEGIKWAFDKRCKYFDFGTTPNHLTGLKQFKEKWGGTSTDLYYSYLNAVSNINRTSMTAKIISNVLSHLPTKLFESCSQIIIKYVV